jgi:Uma2 family endonuclease
MLRLAPGLVRIPDVSYISWNRLPKRRRPKRPIPDLAPDLAIEVLSKSNTRKEMERKLREYFDAGVRLVWFVDPKARTVRVFTGVDESVLLGKEQTLDGGDVLPGFRLRLRELYPRRSGG